MVKPSRSEISTRIQLYLDHCKTNNFRPTLKQVQSAIKRGNKSTGYTCEEIKDIVKNDLSIAVVDDPDYLSASQVAVV